MEISYVALHVALKHNHTTNLYSFTIVGLPFVCSLDSFKLYASSVITRQFDVATWVQPRAFLLPCKKKYAMAPIPVQVTACNGSQGKTGLFCM